MGRNGRVSHALDATAPVPYSTRSALSRPGRRERGPETGGARATVPRTGGASGEDAAGGSWVGQGELCVSRVSAQEVSVGAVSRPDVLAAVAVAEEHGAPSGSHSGAHRCAAQRGERRASLDRPPESRVAGLGELLSDRERHPEVHPDRPLRVATARALSGSTPRRAAASARSGHPLVVRLVLGARTLSLVGNGTLSWRCACLTPRDHR